MLGDLGKGVIQVSIGPGLFVDQFSELAVANGVPVTWTALVARADKPGAALRTVERGAALPGEVYPQIACRPIVMQISMTDPVPLAEIDVWKEVLARPRDERAALYADPAWRDRARDVTLDAWSHRWAKTSVEETGVHHDAVGVPLDELAAARGTTPFDLLLDLPLADGMATRFRIVLDNDGDDEVGDLLADKRTLLGLSDAGAHASQLCDACYSTHLLGHWVRERKALSAGGRRLAAHRAPPRRLPGPRAGARAGGVLRRPGRLRPRVRRHHAGRAGERPARRGRPARRRQHGHRARVGQRRADPHGRRGRGRRDAGAADPLLTSRRVTFPVVAVARRRYVHPYG